MRGKTAKNIDYLVTDKEVLTLSEIENGKEISGIFRRKKNFWNKINTLERSRRTAILRKVLKENEKKDN